MTLAVDTRAHTILDERTAFYNAVAREKYLEGSAERLSSFDAELHGINNSLALLRRQRNMLVPAHRLPIELLSQIFSELFALDPHYYPDPADHEKYASGSLRPRLGWIKAAMQVCHSWRRVALADARLWGAATTSLGKDWLTEMLRLNGGQPTEFDVWDGYGEDNWRPDPASSLLNKVARLQIIGPELDLSVLQKLEAPATLRMLRAHTYSDHGDYPIIDDHLFKGQETDGLQELYLHNFRVRWAPQFFPRNLTQLALTTTERSNIETWPIMSFLINFLNCLHHLERLTIKRYFFWVQEDDIRPEKLVPIIRPRLVHVDIFSSWDAIFILLLCLRPSPSVRFNLASEYPRDSPPDPLVALDIRRLLADYLTENMNSSFLSQMQTVEWRSHAPTQWQGRIAGSGAPAGPTDPVYRNTLVLSAWRANNPDYLMCDYVGYNLAPTPDFRLALQCENAWEPGYEPEDIIAMNAFPAARSVSLQPVGGFAFNLHHLAWGDLFHGSPSLSWLRLDRQVAESFLKARYGHWTSLPKGVKSLALLGVNWGIGAGDMGGPDGSLTRLWTGREERGLALERIIVGYIAVRCDHFKQCVYDADVVFDTVSRPEWLHEGHEDWNDEIAW
ncbi:hypothetical protein PENSPDRAFT_754543 [Peniophora sp. CONT]|nr:hypothetical protein PENSPDRAFT_754543 [Peniophora sp. CONT]